MNLSPFLLFLFLSLLSTFTFSLSSTLDPKHLRALQSLNVPISEDPCTEPAPNNNTVICDTATPFRHITSLHLTNCADDVFLSHTALDSLPTLQDFQFLNCPIATVDFPPDLISALRSFTCIHSLRNLTGEFLNRLENLTDLTVVNSPVTASRVGTIIRNLENLQSVKISESNLTGDLPTHWNVNLSQIDFAGNKISGTIPSWITMLENLTSLDLSRNELTGEIPESFGDLSRLKYLSLASNLLYGLIPDSITGMQSLVHMDFSSNKLNGTIPKFLSMLTNLKYLNLGNNDFDGVLPLSGTFIEQLKFFEIGGNSNLCYNSSTLSSKKIKLGIAPCDEHGRPKSQPPVASPVISPAKAPSSSEADVGSPPPKDVSDYDPPDEPNANKEDGQHHGPSKMFLGLAIGLSSGVFLIIFWFCISKCCC